MKEITLNFPRPLNTSKDALIIRTVIDEDKSKLHVRYAVMDIATEVRPNVGWREQTSLQRPAVAVGQVPDVLVRVCGQWCSIPMHASPDASGIVMIHSLRLSVPDGFDSLIDPINEIRTKDWSLSNTSSSLLHAICNKLKWEACYDKNIIGDKKVYVYDVSHHITINTVNLSAGTPDTQHCIKVIMNAIELIPFGDMTLVKNQEPFTVDRNLLIKPVMYATKFTIPETIKELL